MLRPKGILQTVYSLVGRAFPSGLMLLVPQVSGYASPLLRIETLTGQPVRVKDTQLRVRSQVVQLRLPIGNGGLIWNRPVAVLVRTPDGQDQILPVLNVTRTAVLVLLVLSFAGTFLLMLFRRRTA